MKTSICLDKENLHFKKITAKTAEELEKIFSEPEILSALKDIDKKKSSGPDGFNRYYINMLWEFIKADVDRFH